MTSCPAPPSNWAVKAPVKSRLWVGADGAGLRTVTVGPVTFRNARVRANYAAGRYGYPVRHPFGIPTPTRFLPGRATGWPFGLPNRFPTLSGIESVNGAIPIEIAFADWQL